MGGGDGRVEALRDGVELDESVDPMDGCPAPDFVWVCAPSDR